MVRGWGKKGWTGAAPGPGLILRGERNFVRSKEKVHGRQERRRGRSGPLSILCQRKGTDLGGTCEREEEKESKRRTLLAR